MYLFTAAEGVQYTEVTRERTVLLRIHFLVTTMVVTKANRIIRKVLSSIVTNNRNKQLKEGS